MAEVLDNGLHFVISEDVNGVSCGVGSFIEVWLE